MMIKLQLTPLMFSLYEQNAVHVGHLRRLELLSVQSFWHNIKDGKADVK